VHLRVHVHVLLHVIVAVRVRVGGSLAHAHGHGNEEVYGCVDEQVDIVRAPAGLNVRPHP